MGFAALYPSYKLALVSLTTLHRSYPRQLHVISRSQHKALYDG
jgi:hypothetical protein